MCSQLVTRVEARMRKFPRNEQWRRIEAKLSGKVTGRGRAAGDNRLFVEAMLWIARPAPLLVDVEAAVAIGDKGSDAPVDQSEDPPALEPTPSMSPRSAALPRGDRHQT